MRAASAPNQRKRQRLPICKGGTSSICALIPSSPTLRTVIASFLNCASYSAQRRRSSDSNPSAAWISTLAPRMSICCSIAISAWLRFRPGTPVDCGSIAALTLSVAMM